MKKHVLGFAAALGLAVTAFCPPALAQTAPARGGASGSATLDAVRARGSLRCGVSGEIAGFSLSDSRGEMQGMDVAYCRAIAAAVLGQATKVELIALSAQNRFTALQSGEVDVLIRNTGWSLSREANLGLLFAATNFWDGQGLVVHTSSGVTSAKDLGGAAVCMRPGTSTELDVSDWFRTNRIAFTPVMINGVSEIQEAFLSGRCDAFATDASQLAGFRARQGARAAELTILPERMTLGQAGSMVRKGDDKWFDIVRWTHFAMITAEKLGVTSANIDGFASTDNPDIRRLIGLDRGTGEGLGLDDLWAARIVRQVGNYGENYERFIIPIGLERGHNRLWTEGGLQFSPSFR
ncbi:amino acid ABC transporter substrate-binding protein [Roseomonas nepalensis]|uniref:Amino acid ABC transporter substrate-binding protein n=1 Tax=Muricoccus nepalensis TaxID=1854500 RepID=A0A502FAH6_9PROT|nr:amino acid ABC transporter substrate-binding protein [Roseomonas nepalensis]TPG46362.1 amino acid ABC transporter substrate-binding protein [Roseomonas nepalensis]